MTLASFSAPSRPASMVRRRIAAWFVGGVDAVPSLVSALERQNHVVQQFSLDIRDGVRESGMACTVFLPDEQVEVLLARLRGLPAVVSAELV